MGVSDGFWTWLSNNKSAIGAVGGGLSGLAAVAAIVWQVFVYFDNQREIGGKPSNQADLLAPAPLEPKCESVIPWPGENTFLLFNWRPVVGAASYSVEVDCFDCGREGAWYSTDGPPWHVRKGLGFRTPENPIYSSTVHVDWRAAGGTGLRWRAWAVDEDDREGPKSSWCALSFYGDVR